jgi:hypothetical protein
MALYGGVSSNRSLRLYDLRLGLGQRCLDILRLLNILRLSELRSKLLRLYILRLNILRLSELRLLSVLGLNKGNIHGLLSYLGRGNR